MNVPGSDEQIPLGVERCGVLLLSLGLAWACSNDEQAPGTESAHTNGVGMSSSAGLTSLGAATTAVGPTLSSVQASAASNSAGQSASQSSGAPLSATATAPSASSSAGVGTTGAGGSLGASPSSATLASSASGALSSGSPGAGGTGGSGMLDTTCSELEAEYAESLAEQRECTPNVSPCDDSAAERPGCDCRVPIEPKDPFAIENLLNIEDAWFRASCPDPDCPPGCPGAENASCQSDPQSALGGTCRAL